LKPMIRGGDPVVVEETTPVMEARFEGIALQPAVEGATLDVRLKISGAVVQAVALAPGRVEILRVQGGRR
jgi:flagella basal body P-ring formation protein FlgA